MRENKALPLVKSWSATTPFSLVLEGGAMRCQFTAGVLDCFMERGLLAQEVWGVSAGALAGMNYVSGAINRMCVLNMKYRNDPRYFSVASLLKTGNACGRDFIFNEINEIHDPLDYEPFNGSSAKLYAVSSNLVTGEADYHAIQSLPKDMDYLIASSSLPLFSQPVRVEGKLLLDGGTCDSIPWKASRKKGNRKHILVLTQARCYRKKEDKLLPFEKQIFKDYPEYIERLTHRHFEYNRIRKELWEAERDGEVLILCPPTPVEVKHMEKDPEKLMDLYLRGYREALTRWNNIESYLGE